MKILINIVSMEIILAYIFFTKQIKYKLFLYILLSFNLYFMKSIALSCNLEADVIWGIDFLVNTLTMFNFSIILGKFIYDKMYNKK